LGYRKVITFTGRHRSSKKCAYTPLLPFGFEHAFQVFEWESGLDREVIVVGEKKN
jgi:hypothetical protein